MPNITARAVAGDEIGSSPTGLPAGARGAVTAGAAMTQFVRAPDAADGLSVRVPDAALAPEASEPSPPWSVAAHAVMSTAIDATNGTTTRRFTLMTQRRSAAERVSVGGQTARSHGTAS